MKISIVLTEGAKQIMMTPETEHEKMALKMIGPGETLEVATKWGTYDNEPLLSNQTIPRLWRQKERMD